MTVEDNDSGAFGGYTGPTGNTASIFRSCILWIFLVIVLVLLGVLLTQSH